METFTLTSKDLGGQFTTKHFFNDWGAGGENVSPHLKWVNAPEKAAAFAVTMYDPAAPTGSGWWHWVVFNIPSEISELPSGAGTVETSRLPGGAILGNTDFGKPGYGGPVPIPGSGYHPYLITVHALSKKLDLDASVNPAMVGFQMGGVTIAKASMLVYVHV